MTFFRLYKILTVFHAYRLDELLPAHRLSKWLRFLLLCLFWVKPKAKQQPIGERLRQALQELGPVWIKFGQMISTRRDVLPKDIADALAKLQDQVDPFDGKIAKQLIEQALEQPIDYYFTNFDEIFIINFSFYVIKNNDRFNSIIYYLLNFLNCGFL